MESINYNVSRNIKQIRKEKGLTLEKLAEVSGVSRSMLGEVERGAANPTILVLWKISEGLKVSLSRLIKEEELDYTIVRNQELGVIDQDGGCSVYSIFPYYHRYKSEMLKFELIPGGVFFNDGHMPGADAYIIMISGCVKASLGAEEFFMEQGDSIRFRGNMPHRLTNISAEKAVIINVLNYIE